MTKMNRPGLLIALLSGAGIALPAAAGVTVYKDGEKYVKIGGRIQVQYHYADPDGSDSEDELFFRRLRPYIEGSLHQDWKGKFQFDLGKASGDNEVAIKDAYMQYTGRKNMKVTVGNANFPFSRELLTSSKYQQLVERTFVGDHNYGTPDRNLGLHLTGNSSNKQLVWGASLASAAIDPDKNKLDFDTPVNGSSDFNEGWMIGGRVDFQPMGPLKFSQGDFSGDTRVAVGVGVFSWNNDDDNNTYTVGGVDVGSGKPDIDSVTGFEVSGAVRMNGFSIDAQYNSFDADTVDSAFSGGMYSRGSTELENWSLEGGYMIVPGKLELVAGYESQDADGYADEWNRTSIGANWFINKHDTKVQLTFRSGENIKGVSGKDEDEVFLQTQFVF